jgi:hypothetical protein
VAIVPAPPGGELLGRAEQAEGQLAEAPQLGVRHAAPAASYAVTADDREQPASAPQPSSLGTTLRPGDQMLIVRCEVSDRAGGEAALRDLLSRNSIAWEEPTPSQSGALAGRAKLDRQRADSKQSGKLASTDGQSADETLKPTAEAASEAIVGEHTDEAVYVVADPQQVQGVVKALAADKAFRNVKFEQSSAQAQADLFFSLQPASPGVAEPSALAAPAHSAPAQLRDQSKTDLGLAESATKKEAAPSNAQRARPRGLAAESAPMSKDSPLTKDRGSDELGRAVRVLPGQLSQLQENTAKEPPTAAAVAGERRFAAQQQRWKGQQGQSAPGQAQALFIFRVVPEAAAAQEP